MALSTAARRIRDLGRARAAAKRGSSTSRPTSTATKSLSPTRTSSPSTTLRRTSRVRARSSARSSSGVQILQRLGAIPQRTLPGPRRSTPPRPRQTSRLPTSSAIIKSVDPGTKGSFLKRRLGRFIGKIATFDPFGQLGRITMARIRGRRLTSLEEKFQFRDQEKELIFRLQEQKTSRKLRVAEIKQQRREQKDLLSESFLERFGIGLSEEEKQVRELQEQIAFTEVQNRISEQLARQREHQPVSSENLALPSIEPTVAQGGGGFLGGLFRPKQPGATNLIIPAAILGGVILLSTNKR